MMVVEQGFNEPVNLGSGTGITIKQVAEMVAKYAPHGPLSLVWDTTKPAGDAKRLMDMTRAHSIHFKNEVSLETGIRETMEWYLANRNDADKRYIAFNDPAMKKYVPS